MILQNILLSVLVGFSCLIYQFLLNSRTVIPDFSSFEEQLKIDIPATQVQNVLERPVNKTSNEVMVQNNDLTLAENLQNLDPASQLQLQSILVRQENTYIFFMLLIIFGAFFSATNYLISWLAFENLKLYGLDFEKFQLDLELMARFVFFFSAKMAVFWLDVLLKNYVSYFIYLTIIMFLTGFYSFFLVVLSIYDQ